MQLLEAGRTKKYLTWGALVWLMGLGLFIRVHGLYEYYYSPDEAIELLTSGQPTLDAMWQIGSQEPHPPLWYVVQHFMLKASPEPLFLRSFSLVPSALLIPVFFLLGRRALGTAAGLTMAGIAVFGYGGILISQVMRAYPLAVLAQSVGLLFFLSLVEAPRFRARIGFAVAVLLAFSTIYIQAIVIAAVYAVWLSSLAWRRRPPSDFVKALLTGLPAAGGLAFHYFIHLRRFFATPRFADPIEDWVSPYFFTDLRGLAANFHDLFGYLFLPPVAVPALLLTILGLGVLWRRSRRELVLVFLLVLGFNLALTAAGKFPFGGCRHNFHFFPFAALAVGAAVQAGWRKLLDRLPPERRPAAPVLAVLSAVILSLALTGYYSRSDYLRRYDADSWRELPLKVRDYREGMGVLDARVRAGDLIFASYQTILYLRLESGGAGGPVAANLGRFQRRGRDWHYPLRDGVAKVWDMPAAEAVRRSVHDLAVISRLRPDRSVWVVNFGWKGKIDWMTSDPFWSVRVKGIFERPGVGIYRAPASLLFRP